MKLAHIFVILLFGCVFALALKTPQRINQHTSQNETVLSPNSTTSIDDVKIEFYHLNNETLSDAPLEKRLQLRQRRGPCSCLRLNCGCCAGMNMPQLNIRRQYCTNFTYDPNEFQVQLDVMNNDEVLYQNQFSAKNPPPMCMPVPYTPAQMCIKLFNIFTPGRNLHMCMDIETKVQEKPYLILHFDCMRMGQDGFTLLKPEDNGGDVGTAGESGSSPDPGSGSGGGGGGGLFGSGLFSNRPKPPPPAETTELPQIDTDIFDPITEIKLLS